MRVTVYDGKHHSVDSKEIAFITAGRKAFIDAVQKARPIVLEPIVNVEITAPEANIGDITGDLSARRGQVSGTRAATPGTLYVLGQAPLAELSSYQLRLNAHDRRPGSLHARAEPLRGGAAVGPAAARFATPQPRARLSERPLSSTRLQRTRLDRNAGSSGGRGVHRRAPPVPERLAVRNSTTTGTIGSNEPITAHHRPMRRL